MEQAVCPREHPYCRALLGFLGAAVLAHPDLGVGSASREHSGFQLDEQIQHN